MSAATVAAMAEALTSAQYARQLAAKISPDITRDTAFAETLSIDSYPALAGSLGVLIESAADSLAAGYIEDAKASLARALLISTWRAES